MYYVYMIKNNKGRLYVGVTKELSQRIVYHNNKRGADFTKSGGYESVFIEEYQTLSETRKREIQIKKWRREKKEKLIERFILGLSTKA